MKKTTEMKRDNIQSVRACFYERSSWTKNELALQTGLSLGALTNIIKEMIDQQEISHVDDLTSTGGRRSKLYQLNPHYRHIGLIIVAKTHDEELLEGIIYDLDHHLQWRDMRSAAAMTVSDLQHLIRQMTSDELMTTLVISLPGVSIEGRCVLCDLAGFQDVDLKARIHEVFQGDVVIENDVNVACIALAASYPKRHIAYLYQPQTNYIGCGIVIEGRLYNGASHYAGELRFSPLYSHDEQDMLRDTDPERLLRDYVGILCVMINPELVGLCSDCFTVADEDMFTHMLPEGLRPQVVLRTDIRIDIENGLFSIGHQMVKEKNTYDK